MKKTILTLYSKIFLLSSICTVVSTALIDAEFRASELLFMLITITVYSALATIGCICLSWVIHNLQKGKTNPLAALFVILDIVILWSFMRVIFFPSDFGPLNGAEWMRKFTQIQYQQDYLKLFLALLVSILAYLVTVKTRVNSSKIIAIAAFGICVSLIGGRYYSDRGKQPVKREISDWNVLGKSKNIIVIIADGMQGSIADSVLSQDETLRAKFSDFTLYNRAISPHVFTEFGVPAILSGSTLKWTKETDKTSVLKDSKANNFSLEAKRKNFRTHEFMYSSDLTFNSDVQYSLASFSYKDRILYYTKVGMIRILPLQLLKNIFSTGSDNSVFSDKKTDALNFIRAFTQKISIGTFDNSMIIHHSMLPHPPIHFTIHGDKTLPRDDVSYQEIADETHFSLHTYADFFDRLKTKGVWNSSLIILVADHGSHYQPKEDPFSTLHGTSYYSVGSYNPVILIKRPYQSGPLSVNDSLIATTDVRSIISRYLNSENWQAPLTLSGSPRRTVWATTISQQDNYVQYTSLENYQKISGVTSLDSLFKKFTDELEPHPKQFARTQLSSYNRIDTQHTIGLFGVPLFYNDGIWIHETPIFLFAKYNQATPGDLVLSLDMYGLTYDDPHQSQTMSVRVNNSHVATLNVSQRNEYTVILPKQILNDNTKQLKIELTPLNAITPRDSDNWDPGTKLSVYLYGYTLSSR